MVKTPGIPLRRVRLKNLLVPTSPVLFLTVFFFGGESRFAEREGQHGRLLRRDGEFVRGEGDEEAPPPEPAKAPPPKPAAPKAEAAAKPEAAAAPKADEGKLRGLPDWDSFDVHTRPFRATEREHRRALQIELGIPVVEPENVALEISCDSGKDANLGKKIEAMDKLGWAFPLSEKAREGLVELEKAGGDVEGTAKAAEEKAAAKEEKKKGGLFGRGKKANPKAKSSALEEEILVPPGEEGVEGFAEAAGDEDPQSTPPVLPDGRVEADDLLATEDWRFPEEDEEGTEEPNPRSTAALDLDDAKDSDATTVVGFFSKLKNAVKRVAKAVVKGVGKKLGVLSKGSLDTIDRKSKFDTIVTNSIKSYKKIFDIMIKSGKDREAKLVAGKPLSAADFAGGDAAAGKAVREQKHLTPRKVPTVLCMYLAFCRTCMSSCLVSMCILVVENVMLLYVMSMGIMCIMRGCYCPRPADI